MKHGMYNTPEHSAWRAMKDRCLNPRNQRWDRYGERGISVCQRWIDSFVDFYEDVGAKPTPEHSLERRNNEGDYEPDNVFWGTREEQNNNKSTSRIIERDGVSLTLAQWARKKGMNPRTLCARLEAGWSDEDAIDTPVENRTWVSSAGNRLSPEIKDSIVAARLSGRTCNDVATEFGVCSMTVSKLGRQAEENNYATTSL